MPPTIKPLPSKKDMLNKIAGVLKYIPDKIGAGVVSRQ